VAHVSAEMRDLLVLAHLALAKSVAKPFRLKAQEKRIPRDDLYQEANLALLKAAEAWDPERKQCQFATYATTWIRGELKKLLSRTPRPMAALSEFATIADKRPRLTLELLSPITSFTPQSACPHHGPIARESVFVCIVCHAVGNEDHPALQRDPETDPQPEPKPKAPPLTRKKRETRRARRKRVFGVHPVFVDVA
jgi:RNA polymerase sigma factor (sigma-70 family)